MLEITISNDPSTLGQDATEDDLETFSEALADRVADEFGCGCRCRLASVSRSTVGTTDGNYDLAAQAESWLHEFERGDEWIALLSD
jgi:hypothetical protein